MQGNNSTFGARPAGGVDFTGVGYAWPCSVDPGKWLSVKRAGHVAQLGYLGMPVPPASPDPRRYDPGERPGWPGSALPSWDDYPNRVERFLGGTFEKPWAGDVRGYAPRRELVLQEHLHFRAYWYHAISGGHECTAYDLIEVITLILKHSEVTAHPHVSVLIGDLNMTPFELENILENAFGIFANTNSRMEIGPGECGILATGKATHTAGAAAGQLDYAVVFNYVAPGTPPFGPNRVRARIERGFPPSNAPPPVPDPPPWTPYHTPIAPFAPAGVVAPPIVPVPGSRSDHHPIRLAVEYYV